MKKHNVLIIILLICSGLCKMYSYTEAFIKNYGYLKITDSEHALVSVPKIINVDLLVTKEIKKMYRLSRIKQINGQKEIICVDQKELLGEKTSIKDIDIKSHNCEITNNSLNDFTYIEVSFTNPILNSYYGHELIGSGRSVKIPISHKLKKNQSIESIKNNAETFSEAKFRIEWKGAKAEIISDLKINVIVNEHIIEEIAEIVELTEESREEIVNPTELIEEINNKE